MTTSWDIVRVLYLIEKRPRAPKQIDVALFARNYSFPFIEGGATDGEPPKESDFFYVDTVSVMGAQIDLARPILVALIIMERRSSPD